MTSKDWAHLSAPKASRNRKLFRSIFERKEKDKEAEDDEGWLKLRRGRSSRASSRAQSQANSRATSAARDDNHHSTATAHTLSGTSAALNDHHKSNTDAIRGLSITPATCTPAGSRPVSMTLSGTQTPVAAVYPAGSPEESVRNKLMEDYNIPAESIDLENIRFVLASKFTHNDHAKAVQLIVSFRKAAAGLMHPYVSGKGQYTRLVGADNWNGVSCYFDSLMVAMFARMDNFEPMLYKNFEFDERRESLATLLRFYVSLLRQGSHITTDMTHKLMESLMETGWCDGQTMHRQQDVSELFQFICDKMDMPLLTLKVDIAHGGKEVREDDHKLVNERMLHIPVPGDESDGPILLEQCLEQYFSNSVNVKRQIERRKTLDSLDSVAFRRSRSYSTKSKKYHVHVETVEMLDAEGGSPSTLASRRTSLDETIEEEEMSDKKDPNTLRELQFVDQNRFYRYDRGDWEEEGADRETDTEGGKDDDINENDDPSNRPQSSGSAIDPMDRGDGADTASVTTMVKNPRVSELQRKGSISGQSTRSSLWNENSEITLPAWMFLQLLPFYSNSKGDADSPAAVYFAKSKPVLVICLKRFCWTDAGAAKKNNRTVVIPDTIHFPSFVADQNLDMDYEDSEEAISDEDYETPKHPGSFKLVLESAVCHRGNTVHSGHYVTLVSEQVRRETVGTAVGDEAYPIVPPTEDGKVGTATDSTTPPPSGARHQFRTRSGTVSSRYSATPETAKRRWLRFDDFQPASHKFQEIDFEDAFTQESPYLLFYRMVAEGEEDHEKDYVQPTMPVSDNVTEKLNSQNIPVMPVAPTVHKPSIGNIDMDNGRGAGRARVNFGIGGNTGNTSVGVTEVSVDSDDDDDDDDGYGDTVRDHVTPGVAGTTIKGLDTDSVFEGHESSLNTTTSLASGYVSDSASVSPTDTTSKMPFPVSANQSLSNISREAQIPPITVDSPESRFGSESTASSMSAAPLDSESDAEPNLNKSKSYSSIMSFLRRESYVAPTPVPEMDSLAGTGTVTPTPVGEIPPAVPPSNKKRFFLKKLASHSSEDESKEESRKGRKELEKIEKRERKERRRQEKDKGKGKASDTARSSLDDEDREFKAYRDEKCVIA